MGLRFANRLFDLDAYLNNLRLPGLIFRKPVTIAVSYTETDVQGIDEMTLRLFHWSLTGWRDAAETCSPPSTYLRYPDQNRFEVAICHLSRWGAFGAKGGGYFLYLPLIVRQH